MSPLPLSGKRKVYVGGAQWGDEGKGKIVDYLARWADYNIRFNGGPNAGHTIVVKGVRYAFHLIPSGILYDDQDKVCIMGSGTAIYPKILSAELDVLDAHGQTYDNLRIAENAKLILPQHLIMDMVSTLINGSVNIGPTMRGVGPCYTDHIARIGLTVNDMLNPDIFRKKLKAHLILKLLILKQLNPDKIKDLMQHERLEYGDFYSPTKIFDIDAIVEAYLAYGKRLEPYIACTDELIRQAAADGKKLLFEAAQGTLLDVNDGTVPFVTSSVTTKRGVAQGSGYSGEIDFVLGVVKAYQTRVGRGPFPTELGGDQSYQWCEIREPAITKKEEAERYPQASLNDPDEFLQGVALRKKGNEYGTSTGRLRRVGWLDLPLLRHAIRINGQDLVITLLDVLTGFQTIKVCVAYRYIGAGYKKGEIRLKPSDIIKGAAFTDPDILDDCLPIYQSLPGWDEDISQVTSLANLPVNARKYLDFIAKQTNARITMISVGPDREQMIV